MNKRSWNSPKPVRCALLCVGSELLRGKINTHASALAGRLASAGIAIQSEQTFADDEAPLARAIAETLRAADLVIVTGGLGPTFDDVTREAAARATGRPLEFSRPLWNQLIRRFKRAGFRMPPANKRQAFLIKGAEALNNAAGTAPGQWLSLDETVLVLLPGPPSELVPMLERELLPRLRKAFPARPSAQARLHFIGVPESVVDQRMRPLIARAEKNREADIRFTILAHLALVDFEIYVSGPSRPRAGAILKKLVGHITRRMGNSLYGMDDAYPLEKVVGARFIQKGLRLAVAESCTGGLLAARLTDAAGSSAFFQGGIVSYSNAVKAGALGVPRELLARHGAVSAEAARAMAQNVRARLGADWGLSITGVAGPSGGTARKPVGTVFIGLAHARGAKISRFLFHGSRDVIRQRSVLAALDLLRTV